MALPIIAGLIRVAGAAFSRGAMTSIARSFSSNIAQALKSGGNKGLIRPVVKVDTSSFDRAFREYIKHSKKDMAEIVNTKAYYICRNAVLMTDATDKNAIEAELRAASEVYPEAPLAAILAAKAQKRTRFSKKTGKRLKDRDGLYGSRMSAAVEKIIRVHKNTTNFLRSGWIPAIKAMERFVPKKTGPNYPKVKVQGKPKGGAKGAPTSGMWKSVASIWNEVSGGTKTHGLNKRNNPSKVAAILEKGLQKAIDKETASMKAYVEKKLQETANRFNRA